MEYNEDRESLKNVPTSTLPPTPRFDAVASAAARPVEPLATTRIQVDLHQKPEFSRLINRRSKFLALMAIVGLATGAAGGILVVKSDKQQSQTSASTIQLPAEHDSVAPALESSNASLEASASAENQVPVRRRQGRPRQQPKRDLIVLSDSDDDEELDRDEDNDDEEEKDRNDDERGKNEDREPKRKDRDHDADSRRGDRNRALLYDTMRVRKP